MKNPLTDGVYAMLVTPMRGEEGEVIDLEAMREEIRWSVAQGACGIVVTPSIGEYACLDQDEWRACLSECRDEIRNASEKIGKNIISIAMVAGACTLEVQSRIRTAIEMEYDACQLIAPYYWKPADEEIVRHYQYAAEEGLPIVVYHNPAISKAYFSRELFTRLACIDGVVGIKEVLTDRHVELEPLFKRVRKEASHVKIFTTFRVFSTGLVLGSNGGFINVFALPFCRQLWEQFQSTHKIDEELQISLNNAFPRGGEGNTRHIGTTKVTASLVTGIDMGPPRAPYLLPSYDVIEEMSKRLKILSKKYPFELCPL